VQGLLRRGNRSLRAVNGTYTENSRGLLQSYRWWHRPIVRTRRSSHASALYAVSRQSSTPSMVEWYRKPAARQMRFDASLPTRTLALRGGPSWRTTSQTIFLPRPRPRKSGDTVQDSSRSRSNPSIRTVPTSHPERVAISNCRLGSTSARESHSRCSAKPTTSMVSELRRVSRSFRQSSNVWQSVISAGLRTSSYFSPSILLVCFCSVPDASLSRKPRGPLRKRVPLCK